MPNIKSAKKRVKVIATKTARNKATKSAQLTLTLTTKQRQFVLLLRKLTRQQLRVFFTRTLQQEANHHLLKDLTHQHKCNKSYRLKSREYSLLFYFVLLTFL